MKFYGRKEELSTLSAQLPLLEFSSRLVVITGRRRIGKTTLINKFADESSIPSLYIFIQKGYSEQELVKSCINLIRTKLDLTGFPPNITKLSEFVEYCMQLSKSSPLILIFDECQELDFAAPRFWSELQNVWDKNKNNSKLLLLMSGSILSAIKHIFSDKNEPLYGRTDLLLKINPFSSATIREYLTDRNSNVSSEELLLFFAMTGGVPRYMEIISSSVDCNITGFKKFLFSQLSSWFRQDGFVLLGNEFRMESSAYFSLLRAIANGKTQWFELQNEVQTNLAPYMSRLETQFNLIKKNYPVGRENSARGARYLLTDEYFRFWFKFVEPATYASLYESSQWKLLDGLFNKNWNDYSGRTLENWYLKKYSESGDWTSVGQWWDRKGENEIDLIAVNELNRTIQFAEVKRNIEKIKLSELKRKVEVFLLNNHKYEGFKVTFKALPMHEL